MTKARTLANLGAVTSSATELNYVDGVTSALQTQLNDNKNNISTLALREATNENAIAFNLSNQFTETFTDNTKLSTETSGSVYNGVWHPYGSTATDFASDSNTLLLCHFNGSDQSTDLGGDSSSYDHTLNRNNAVGSQPHLVTATKKVGTAAVYCGDGDGTASSHGNHINCVDHADFNLGSSDFTMEGWIYMTTSPSQSGNTTFEILNQAMSNTTDIGGAWHFNIQNDGKLNWNPYQKNGSNTNDDFYDFRHPTSGSLATATWHHCCVARDGNTLRMYINGVQEGTKPFSGNLTDNNLGGNIYMSRRSYNSSYGYVRGYLDEIRFSNVCRYPDGHSFVPNTSISATATAIQSTNTVSSAKTAVSGVMIYEDFYGTATIGTDLKIYFTCNGGTNWTESSSYTAVTPLFASGVKMIKLGETTCTSGTDVRYKAVWANQVSRAFSSPKETRLHGIGVNY